MVPLSNKLFIVIKIDFFSFMVYLNNIGMDYISFIVHFLKIINKKTVDFDFYTVNANVKIRNPMTMDIKVALVAIPIIEKMVPIFS